MRRVNRAASTNGTVTANVDFGWLACRESSCCVNNGAVTNRSEVVNVNSVDIASDYTVVPDCGIASDSNLTDYKV